MPKAKPVALKREPLTLPRASWFDIESKLSGRPYRISVFEPYLPPPGGGYPVVTVTDAFLTFPVAATQSGAMTMGGQSALVVGVGYPSNEPLAPMLLRMRDLTPETPLARIRQIPGMPPPSAEDYGGAELFYQFLVEELRPAIAAAFKVDPARQTLYGHSLGGLFALGVLFRHPEAFQTYAASSPSIWWNRRALVKLLPAFENRVAAGQVAARALVMVGGLEQTVPAVPPPGYTAAQARKLVREALMVDNARELGARLAALKGGPGYHARFVEFEDEDHMSVVPASLSRTLSFALAS
jgi:predicted alpha/beta superfamily hydrolase